MYIIIYMKSISYCSELYTDGEAEEPADLPRGCPWPGTSGPAGDLVGQGPGEASGSPRADGSRVDQGSN